MNAKPLNKLEAGAPDSVTAGVDPDMQSNVSEFSATLNGTPEVQRDGEIPSVNSKKTGAGGNKTGKRVFMAIGGALLLGGLLLFGQNWLTTMKEKARESTKGSKNSPSTAGTTANMLNPEGSARLSSQKAPKLGAAAASAPGPGLALGAAAVPVAASNDANAVRALRGPDGKTMVNGAGKAVGVDAAGNIVEIPAITLVGGETSDRKPLPGDRTDAAAARGGQASRAGSAEAKKPPSRFGGALYADGSAGSRQARQGTSGPADTREGSEALRDDGAPGTGARGGTPSAATGRNAVMTDVLNKLVGKLGGEGGGGGIGAALAPAAGKAGAANQDAGGQGTGPVGSQMNTSATPVARAKRSMNPTLTLPKNRQVDCILTTRIINELPGYTTCVTTTDMYSADGRVVLLEKGSEIGGEYGMSNQQGLRRLFVVWSRARTPLGVEIDLNSPGTDALGTSGVPGYLEQRWMERIGAALMISVMKDVVALAMARESEGSGTNVVVQQPGQNTMQTGQSLAEQVLRQTMNVKPTLYIEQGARIAIYVSRDLDFSPVYDLKTMNVSAAKAPQ